MEMLAGAAFSHILQNSIWSHLLLAAVFGTIGAVGNILLSGSFVPSKRIIVPDGQAEQEILIFGSIRELGIGAIGAMLTTTSLYTGQTSDMKTMIAAALIAGFGGSNFIKRYIAAKTEQMVAAHKEEAAKQDEQIQIIPADKEQADAPQQATLGALHQKIEALTAEVQKSDSNLSTLQPLTEELKELYNKMNKQGSILLTGDEIRLLHELRGQVRTAGCPSEAKVYQSKIRLLLEKGKARSFS
ncbi:hypothetical protein [Ectobacillus ponti]|uniref:Uncharacterized protein n=1 Tax=Ectobacillus ponti TaxID=2961894 RepID=A0AA41XBJ6_9BACI|nr:hypothetical protein [Ectobacillus ponti]MCP8970445.1 hypothetical protein [Ectobacillus ponti]